jgi:hypothetical protein
MTTASAVCPSVTTSDMRISLTEFVPLYAALGTTGREPGAALAGTIY